LATLKTVVFAATPRAMERMMTLANPGI